MDIVMYIEISVAKQQLLVRAEDGAILHQYSVSTAKQGVGEEKGSERTPRGRHIIRAKIGARVPVNAVFIGRRFTGEIYSDELGKKYPQRDWILSRILWLSGCAKGFNRLKNVDSMQRYIYIHGTPDSESMGIPASHGCIRMHNNDVIDLFDRVPVGCIVDIHAN